MDERSHLSPRATPPHGRNPAAVSTQAGGAGTTLSDSRGHIHYLVAHREKLRWRERLSKEIGKVVRRGYEADSHLEVLH